MTDLKKLTETDRLASAYITALYRLLPTFDVGDIAQEDMAKHVLGTIASTIRFQRRIHHGFSTGFTDACSTKPLPASHDTMSLTPDEQAELRELIQKHGIYAAMEDGSAIIYVTHESITGRAQALNEREVFEIAKDIDEQTR